MYNRLRHEYLTKAQENHRRGMYAVATYYASEVSFQLMSSKWILGIKHSDDLQSRRYANLYSEAHQKAASQIVGEKNAQRDERTIDLHELRVIEALSYLETFITENIRGFTLKHIFLHLLEITFFFHFRWKHCNSSNNW